MTVRAPHASDPIQFRGVSTGSSLTEFSSTTIHLILPHLWPTSATRHGLRISMGSWDSLIYEVGEQVPTPQPASPRGWHSRPIWVLAKASSLRQTANNIGARLPSFDWTFIPARLGRLTSSSKFTTTTSMLIAMTFSG